MLLTDFFFYEGGAFYIVHINLFDKSHVFLSAQTVSFFIITALFKDFFGVFRLTDFLSAKPINNVLTCS